MGCEWILAMAWIVWFILEVLGNERNLEEVEEIEDQAEVIESE